MSPRNGTSAAGVFGDEFGGRLREFLHRVISDTGIPGIAVAVRAGGETWHAAAGHAASAGTALSARHRFHAGCTMKLLLAAVVLELAVRGRLNLDDPLEAPLPELSGTVHGRTVLVRHLLSHTSGYRGTRLLDPDTQALDWPLFSRYLHTAPQLFAPGSVFSYEHTESVLLARIVTRITGHDAEQVVRETLLAPLGIEPGTPDALDEAWQAGRHDLDPRFGRFVPASSARPLAPFWRPAFSSMALSPIDLARIAQALLVDGEDAPSLVTAETRTLLRRPVVKLPPTFGGPSSELLPIGFGLGAAELRGGLFGHNGLTHGQCVALRADPSAGFAAAIGVNATVPHLRDFVLGAVCAELNGRGAEEEPATPFELDLGALIGRYEGPGRGHVVASRSGQGLKLELARHGVPSLLIGFSLDAAGRPVVQAPLPQLSVGFFRHAGTGEACLMLGLCAYKHVDGGASSR